MMDCAGKRDKVKKAFVQVTRSFRSPLGKSRSRIAHEEASTLSSTASSGGSGPGDDTVESDQYVRMSLPCSDLGEAPEPSSTTRTTQQIVGQPTTTGWALRVPAITVPPGERQQGPQISSNLWNKALAKLAKDEQEFIKEAHGDAPVDSLFDALSTSIAEKQRDAQLRRQPISAFGRTFCVRDIMVKIADCIQRFKEVGDVAASFDPVHAALPWAAFRFLLQCVTAEAEQTGLLLILLERIGPLVLRGEIYERIYLETTASTEPDARLALERALVNLYTAILSAMCAATRLFGKGAARQAMHAVAYPNEIKSLVDKLEEKAQELGAEAQACEGSQVDFLHRETSREFRRLREILEKPLARIDDHVERMWTKVESSERGAMLQWISPIPYESDHEFARRGRLEGSGEWLLEREGYREWRNSSSSTVFWLHGIPGAGKTKLSSKVVDDLLSIIRELKTDDGLAYFYCDRNREDRHEPDMILRSLVRQLSSGQKDNAKVVQAMYDIFADQQSKGFPAKYPSVDKCRELLPALLAAYTQAIIVVDGLDECNPVTREELMDVLENIIDVPTSLVKIFVASRNDADLTQRYGGGRHLQVEAAHNQGDIEKCVASKMERTRNPLFQEKMSNKTKRQIRKTFRDKSQGMFQWAKIQIDELLSLQIESDVIAYLNRLPKGLTQAYDNLIDKILEQEGKAPVIATRAFLWIMASRVALAPDELVRAVQQNPDTEGAEPEDTDVDLKVVLSMCHNLITTTGPEDRQVCRFSHLSVQEYLELYLEERIRRHPQIPARSAKTHVGMVCLRVLTDARFLPDDDDDYGDYDCEAVSYKRGRGATGILRIVDDGWPFYVQDCNPESPAEVDGRAPLLHHFLGSPQVSSRFYQHWMSLYTPSLSDHYVYQSFECTSFGMAYFGLSGALRSWADQIDFSVVGEEGVSLLHLATKEGHWEVCKLLLEQGVKVNVLDGYNKTPLLHALEKSHPSVAELLLKEGRADPNLGHGRASPLALAIWMWREKDLVALLLEKGANPDEQAINAAIQAEDLDLLQRLLDLGGHAASNSMMICMGMRDDKKLIETARILIDREHVDLNHVDEYESTALIMAIWRGGVEAVEFLLDHGAHVNITVADSFKPLQWAARYGQATLIPLLLLRGADLNYVDDKYYYSPLYLAYVGLRRLEPNERPLREKDYRDSIRALQTAGARLLSPPSKNSEDEAEHRAILKLHEQYISDSSTDDKM